MHFTCVYNTALARQQENVFGRLDTESDGATNVIMQERSYNLIAFSSCRIRNEVSGSGHLAYSFRQV